MCQYYLFVRITSIRYKQILKKDQENRVNLEYTGIKIPVTYYDYICARALFNSGKKTTTWLIKPFYKQIDGKKINKDKNEPRYTR